MQRTAPLAGPQLQVRLPSLFHPPPFEDLHGAHEHRIVTTHPLEIEAGQVDG